MPTTQNLSIEKMNFLRFLSRLFGEPMNYENLWNDLEQTHEIGFKCEITPGSFFIPNIKFMHIQWFPEHARIYVWGPLDKPIFYGCGDHDDADECNCKGSWENDVQCDWDGTWIEAGMYCLQILGRELSTADRTEYVRLLKATFKR